MSDRSGAVVPGSFDPLTRGHLDVIRRAAGLFSRIWVGVVENPSKRALFTLEERVALLRRELEGLVSVEVVSYRGLTVRLAGRLGARWIVRGVRSAADVAEELPMAWSNLACGEDVVETLFVPTRPELAFISSRLVREIAAAGGDLSAFVTPSVEDALRARFPPELGPGTEPEREGPERGDLP